MPILEVLTGDLEGRAFAIEDRVFSIGRKADNDLVLPKKHFSRRHAEILNEDGDFIVRGLSRKNPIFAEDRETQELVLHDGLVFEICDVRFRFRAKGEPSPADDKRTGSASRTRHRFGAESDPPDDKAGLAGVSATDFLGDSEEEDDDTEALAAHISAARQRSGLNGRSNTSAAREGSTRDLPFGAAEAHDDDFSNSDEESIPSDAAPPERIVFGADDDDDFDDDEKTGVVERNADDDDEATGMLDVIDLDVRKEDPFAKKKAKGEQDKLMKIVSFVGLGAIAVAGLMVLTLDDKPPPVHRVSEALNIGREQVTVLEVDFQSKDPPVAFIVPGQGAYPARYTMWMTVIEDDVARVEWVMPTLRSRSIFVVTGKAKGKTSFTLRYALNNDTKEFPIVIKGVGPELKERKKRMAALAAKRIDDIKEIVRNFVRSGDELWRERFTRGSTLR